MRKKGTSKKRKRASEEANERGKRGFKEQIEITRRYSKTRVKL